MTFILFKSKKVKDFRNIFRLEFELKFSCRDIKHYVKA